MIKRFLPKSLLGRTLLITVTPLVLLQVVSTVIFFGTHWDKVQLRLARNIAGDIATIADLLRRDPSAEGRAAAFELAADHMEIVAVLRPGEILPNAPPPSTAEDEILAQAMLEYVGKPFRIDTEAVDRHVLIDVQLPEGVLEILTTRKRLFSTTTSVFVLWMVGTSMILFAVATIFMRNQVKPVRRLAHAADNFGKGRDVVSFKPEGANEVRQAAQAFIAMRDRISRQIRQRTEMLAGVSHDLRTPLTRLKLQLALLGDREGVAEMKEDVADMERMLDGYLAFARGEGEETPVPTSLGQLLGDVVGQARRNGAVVDLHTEGEITVPLRPNVLKRCLTNLVENATRYADHVWVRAGRRGDAVEISIDDDGPGIPEDKREDVFRPFFRLDGSRNPATGGVGLGLTIARDVVRGHGGDITLADSPNGGLRARVRLPL